MVILTRVFTLSFRLDCDPQGNGDPTGRSSKTTTRQTHIGQHVFEISISNLPARSTTRAAVQRFACLSTGPPAVFPEPRQPVWRHLFLPHRSSGSFLHKSS